jgi:hypothetical protein
MQSTYVRTIVSVCGLRLRSSVETWYFVSQSIRESSLSTRRKCEMSRETFAERGPPWLASYGANREGPQGVAFLCSGALAVVSVGVVGLLHDSRHGQVVGSLINVPALFGLLLCGLVIARFYRRAKHSPLVVPADVRDFSRQLSRMVYILLYATIGVRQIICIVDSNWHGAYGNGFGPSEDFQVFVVYGLVALAVIRVLAFAIGLRVADAAADV